jgi:hypothetical protein
MPATTPTRHYPYPLDPDTIDPAGDIQRLAEAVDPDVNAINTELGTNPSGSYGTVAARLAEVDDDLQDHAYQLEAVGGRTTALENSALTMKRFAHVIYNDITINDYEFPALTINRIGYGHPDPLVTQINSQSVVLNRTTCVSMTGVIPCHAVGASGGVGSLSVLANGGIACGHRQWLPLGVIVWLTSSVTWVWAAGTTFQLQFGAVYSSGMRAVNGTGMEIAMTFAEIGPS